MTRTPTGITAEPVRNPPRDRPPGLAGHKVRLGTRDRDDRTRLPR
ncbi:hypothetical protein ACPXCS_08775 [Streptomyces sp. DT190]